MAVSSQKINKLVLSLHKKIYTYYVQGIDSSIIKGLTNMSPSPIGNH